MMCTLPTNLSFPGRVRTDNLVFRLHYRWTVLLLVSCSLVVTCRLVLGHSFSCQPVDGVPQLHLETKCYGDGVYSLPGQLVRSHNRGARASPSPTAAHHASGFRRYQHFYQWVNLLLLVQAALFYLPHLAWESYESGSLDRLTRVLEARRGTRDEERRRCSELCHLAKYLLATRGRHKVYAGVYAACEVLNYAVSLGQTLWLVHFFAVTGVPEFLPFHVATWSDFQKFYFPTSGTCSTTFDKVHHQTSCLLPLNGLYMSVFLFVHAWYIGLTILSGMVLVYRLVMLAPSQRVAVVRLSCPWAERSTLASLCQRLSYADWFFLTRFQKAMSDVDFAQILDKIAVVSAAGNGCDVLRGVENDDRSLSSADGRKNSVSLADESPV